MEAAPPKLLTLLIVFSVITAPVDNMPGVLQGTRTFKGNHLRTKEKNLTIDISQCNRLIITHLKRKNDDTNSSSKARPIYSNITDCNRYQIVTVNEKIEIFRNDSVIKTFDGVSEELVFTCSTNNALWNVSGDCSNGPDTIPCDISCLPDVCKEEYVDGWKEEEIEDHRNKTTLPVEMTNITTSAGQHPVSSTGLIDYATTASSPVNKNITENETQHSTDCNNMILYIILIILAILMRLSIIIIYFCCKDRLHCPRCTSDYYNNFQIAYTENSGQETTFINPPEESPTNAVVRIM